jgi:hypothetical protein
VADAIGARVCDLPLTPERVWRALNNQLDTDNTDVHGSELRNP